MRIYNLKLLPIKSNCGNALFYFWEDFMGLFFDVLSDLARIVTKVAASSPEPVKEIGHSLLKNAKEMYKHNPEIVKDTVQKTVKTTKDAAKRI